MPGRNETHLLDTAVSAAYRAGEIVLNKLGKITGKDIGTKFASDYVTTVDRESEQAVIDTIRAEFPGDGFLAEESGAGPGSADYRWIIDPLDGTTNYIHEYPVFSISIALEYKGELVLGVIFDPTRDELFTAQKGKGAFLRGRPLRVSGGDDFGKSLISTGFPFRRKEMIGAYLEVFNRLFSRVSDMRRAGSAAIDLAYLACGRCDGFFEIGLGPWDIAAGSVIIKEAGGTVTDFGGGDDFISTGNIVAGTPSTHPEILKEVQRVFRGVIDK